MDIGQSGLYKLSYLDDEYSPWPNEQSEGYRGWTNIIEVYINSPVKWGTTDYGLTGPIDQDVYIGPGGYYLNKNEAISAASGDYRQLRSNAGDYLTIVTLDEKGRYFDNRGKIDLELTYLSPE